MRGKILLMRIEGKLLKFVTVDKKVDKFSGVFH